MVIRCQLLVSALVMIVDASSVFADESTLVADAAPQPLLMQAQRVAAALDQIGSPLLTSERARIAALSDAPQDSALALAVQELMDTHCLAVVHINPERRVKVARGAAPAKLAQGGWTAFLVKVINESGTQAALNVRRLRRQISSGAPGWCAALLLWDCRQPLRVSRIRVLQMRQGSV